MRTYTLTEVRNRHGEVFDQAAIEPVLLTKQSRPSHVILSARDYQLLINRLQELEDLTLGKLAEAALKNLSMVGSETFTAALKRLTDGEA